MLPLDMFFASIWDAGDGGGARVRADDYCEIIGGANPAI